MFPLSEDFLTFHLQDDSMLAVVPTCLERPHVRPRMDGVSPGILTKPNQQFAIGGSGIPLSKWVISPNTVYMECPTYEITWVIYGLYMGYIWVIYGLYMGYKQLTKWEKHPTIPSFLLIEAWQWNSSIIFPARNTSPNWVEDLPAVFDDTKGYCRALKQPLV